MTLSPHPSNKLLTGVLPNGITYYILENLLPENRACLNLVVNVGSASESDDERGFAHFVEHLVFMDTARFPKLYMDKYLQSLGMYEGNAETSCDWTKYCFEVPTEIEYGVKRIPDTALAILDDITYAANFLPEDVKSESRVIVEEIRKNAGARERMGKKIVPILYAGSAYAHCETCGLAGTIESATPEQLKAFYKRWYTSDNMALIFVGDFDAKELEADLARHFHMPASVQPAGRLRHELPPPRKGNFTIKIITDPECTATSLEVYYKQRQPKEADSSSRERKDIIDNIIRDMLFLRLKERLADPETAATDFFADIMYEQRNSSFYCMIAHAKTGRAEEALQELLLEKESMCRFGFTRSEIKRAKMNTLASMDNCLSEKDNTASIFFIDNLMRNFLYGERIFDAGHTLDVLKAQLPTISQDEIAEAAREYFAADDCTVFLLAPQSEENTLPSADRVQELLKKTAPAHLSPRQDEYLSYYNLLSTMPPAGGIELECFDYDTDAHMIFLSNGAKVILKTTSNQNSGITLKAVAGGGTTSAPQNAITSANYLQEMIAVSGLGPYSQTELSKRLLGKHTSLSFWIAPSERWFHGSSTAMNLYTLFEMIYLFFVMPRLDIRAINASLDRWRTALRHLDKDPHSVFDRETHKIISNNHPLLRYLEVEDLDSISIRQAIAFLRQCLNPAEYTFVFAGNIDIDFIRKLSLHYIASIPNASSMSMGNTPEILRPVGGRRSIYKGKEEKSLVYLGWFADDAGFFDKNPAAIVLTKYLYTLLSEKIRGDLGGVYSLYAGAFTYMTPRRISCIKVQFPCSPSRAEELIAAVKQCIADIAKHPIDQVRFDNAKKTLLMEHAAYLQDNEYIAWGYASSLLAAPMFDYTSLFDGVPMLDCASKHMPMAYSMSMSLKGFVMYPDSIRAVRPEDMQAFCRDVLDAVPVQLVLYPEHWR